MSDKDAGSDDLKDTMSLIKKDFEIEVAEDEDNEQVIIDMLSSRVAELIENDIDLLLSYLYRLDVEESRIDFILNHQMTIPAHIGIAQLIWDRQKQRAATKKEYGQGDMIEGWEF